MRSAPSRAGGTSLFGYTRPAVPLLRDITFTRGAECRQPRPLVNPPRFFRMNPRKALPAAQLIQNPENTLLSFNTNAERLKVFKHHQKGQTLVKFPPRSARTRTRASLKLLSRKRDGASRRGSCVLHLFLTVSRVLLERGPSPFSRSNPQPSNSQAQKALV